MITFFKNRLNRHVTTPIQSFRTSCYDTITSTKTQHFALNTVIFSVVFGTFLAVALALYGIFYWAYVPQVRWVVPVYMQFGLPDEKQLPSAIVHFQDSGYQSTILTHEQHYDLSLALTVPDSSRNLHLGNFMVHLDLQTKANQTIASASRPALLEYRSPMLLMMRTIWRAMPLVLGFASESQTIEIPLLERFEENERLPTDHAILRLSSPDLQLYSSSLQIEANFQGLRFFMYHWPVTTAAVFVSFLMLWETMLMFVIWRLGLSILDKKEEEDPKGASETTHSDSGESMAKDHDDMKLENDEEEREALMQVDDGMSDYDIDDAVFYAPTRRVPDITVSNLPQSPHSYSSAPSYRSDPLHSPPHYPVSSPSPTLLLDPLPRSSVSIRGSASNVPSYSYTPGMYGSPSGVAAGAGTTPSPFSLGVGGTISRDMDERLQQNLQSIVRLRDVPGYVDAYQPLLRRRYRTGDSEDLVSETPDETGDAVVPNVVKNIDKESHREELGASFMEREDTFVQHSHEEGGSSVEEEDSNGSFDPGNVRDEASGIPWNDRGAGFKPA
ncbi:Berardinelli-Seip congenital lipodystrophy 2 (seipin) [Gaertneriomyces sp. JEL0708]|nr:Berardinelli-Seip congenital lipodystrophy 2 (seipin) [Gaertneriomyces sp. JEL0708]